MRGTRRLEVREYLSVVRGQSSVVKRDPENNCFNGQQTTDTAKRELAAGSRD